MNILIESIYFDDCDGEMEPVAMGHFSIDGKSYDQVPLNEDFTINHLDEKNKKSFDVQTIKAINEAIKNRIQDDGDSTNENKINNLISDILVKTNQKLQFLKKSNSYVISKFDKETGKWNILQVLDNRTQTEMYLENLLNKSKKAIKRLNANISEYLHDSFRAKCEEDKVDMQFMLEKMIREYIS